MILTRSTRLIQPQGPVEVSPDFGGRGVVYLPNVQSGITRVAGTVGRTPSPQGISAVYTAGAETKIERLNGSAPNGVTEFTQIAYLTPIAGGAVNDRGVFGNWNTTGATGFVQIVHRARDATTNGRYCYVASYDPTSGATAAGIRTSDYSAVDNVPALLVATVKNNTLSLYLNGVLHGSTAVAAVAMSSQADLQIGNYYDNASARRLSATVHLAAFIPRGLGGSEVAALSRNPWQLFRPVQRRVYFDMGAGGSATGYTLSADVGDYLLTGVDAALTYTPASSVRSIVADAGVYSLSGGDALLPRGFSEAGEYGSYAGTGQDASLKVARLLAGDFGDYTLSGGDASLTATGAVAYNLAGDAGQYAITGVSASLIGPADQNADTHDGYFAKQWIKASEQSKRKIEALEDQLEEIQEQIEGVKSAPEPKRTVLIESIPVPPFEAKAKIIEALIEQAERIRAEIDDEEVLLLL